MSGQHACFCGETAGVCLFLPAGWRCEVHSPAAVARWAAENQVHASVLRGCFCDGTDVRLFPGGWRCEAHAPAAIDAGRYCAPFRCYCGECLPLPTERGVPDPGVARVARPVPTGLALSELDLSDDRLGEPEWLVLRVLGGAVLPGGSCQYGECKAPGAQHGNGVWCRKHERKMERVPRDP